MQITVRTKAISKERQTIFLDIYPPIPHPETGKLTRKVYLGLYLYDKPKTDLERKHNTETKKLAENIKAKRLLEIQNDNFGFLKVQTGNNDFLSFFKEIADNIKTKSNGEKNNWISVYKHLCKYTNNSCLMKDLNENFVADFKEYILSTKPFIETKEKLANNSAVGYFNIFRRVVKDAYRRNQIQKDFGADISAIRKTETRREYLTYDELKLLAKTD